MRYPYIEGDEPLRQSIINFGGYNHNDAISEGEFYDMQNMTTEKSPVISTRQRRGKDELIENFQGILDKDSLVWVDGASLIIDDEAVSGLVLSTELVPKKLYKMGGYIVIFPDKVWYNTKDGTYGNMESSIELENTSITMRQVNSKGENITLSNTASDGNYKIDTRDGKSTLMVYSATAKMWMAVATTYFKISATNIGKDFKKGDGVKISADFTGIDWSRAKDIFVNDEGDGVRSSNFVIHEKDDDYIIIIGLLDRAVATFDGATGANHFPKISTFKVERKTPDMSHLCECQNRLWGCAPDGHEIYCCKLGDVTNWNCFAGISTDSWTATVGSDGVFTGAIAYMGYPIFFKEESLLKVNISSYGAHSYKETVCRGVQEGSADSLVQLNELIYYKAVDSVCVYDGNFPQTISEALGNVRYSNAVGGSNRDRYYLNMKDANNEWHLFVYDALHNLWSREDSIQIKAFCRHDDDLVFVDKDNYLMSVFGTIGDKEGKFDWILETGNIGYQEPDKKYVARFNIRMALEIGTHVAMLINYDSSNRWDFVFDMSGKGTKTFTIPVRPRRCDHFKFKLMGNGDAKIFSITKEYAEGSDI